MSQGLTKEQKRGCLNGCMGLIIILILGSILITSCFNRDEENKAFDFTVDEYESTLKTIIDKNKGNSFIEMKGKKLVDGKYHINTMDAITVVIEVNKADKVTAVYGVAKTNAFLVYNKELQITYKAIIASVDNTLGLVQQFSIMDNLDMTWDSKMLDKNKVYIFNDVMYGYRGSTKDDSVILKAEPN